MRVRPWEGGRSTTVAPPEVVPPADGTFVDEDVDSQPIRKTPAKRTIPTFRKKSRNEKGGKWESLEFIVLIEWKEISHVLRHESIRPESQETNYQESKNERTASPTRGSNSLRRRNA
jgi:hypothetical protein